MKLLATICGLAALLLSGGHPSFIQQSAGEQKTLTPDQQKKQRQWHEYTAKHHDLQGRAKQLFDTEMARERAGECSDASTTYDINTCFGKELATTDANLKSYGGVIRELIVSAPGASETAAHGDTDASLGTAQSVAEFDHVQQTWGQYRDTACTAAFHQFDGGTGGPSFELQCRLTLDRDHMRELSLIYGGDLRL